MANIQIYGELPSKTTETPATTLTINDAEETKLKGLTILGDTSQQTYTGKNLFDKDHANIYQGSFSNYNATFNSSGNAKTLYIPCQANTTYTASKIASARFNLGTTTEIPAVGVSVSNIVEGTANVTTSLTITTPNDAVYLVMYYFLNGSEAKTEEQIRNTVQIELGNQATTYEPYVGGTPAPSPDYPQPISVVTGDVKVKVLGKNLVDFSTPVGRLGNTTTYTFTNDILDISCTASNYSGEQYDVTDLFKIYAGQKVSIAFKSITNRIGVGSIAQFNVYHNDGSPITYLHAIDTNGTPATYLTIPSNTANIDYVRLVIYANNTNTSGAYRITIEKPMLVIYGNDTTNYEPYIEQEKTISLGEIELCKIANYQDKIYKENGKWWLYKRVVKLVLDGTNCVPRKGTTTDNDRFVFDIYRIEFPQTFGNTSSRCNRLVYSSNNPVPSWRNVDYGSQIIVNFTAYDETTLEEFKTWLAQNNLIFYQPLKTPTTTEITDQTLISQLETLLNLQLTRGTNNIFTITDNLNPPLAATYTENLSKYVINI